MANRSYLYVDQLRMSWKYHVPTFATFLFDEDDYYEKWDAEDNGFLEEAGYETTAAESIAVLERYGYSLDTIAEVYDFFYDEVFWDYEECAKESIAVDAVTQLDSSQIDARFLAHVSRFPRLSRLEEVRDFVKLLCVLLRTSGHTSPRSERGIVRLADGRDYVIDAEEYARALRAGNALYVDFEALQMYVLDKYLSLPPWIILLCSLFEEEYLREYPEIVSLMFVRLVLEASSAESPVRLELAEILQEPGEARALHVMLANRLVSKVNLYSNVFRTLFRDEEDIRTRYVKIRCADLMRACDSASSNAEKGRLLETLTQLIFTSNNSLELVNKRVSTGDEEIDLVFKNNIDRPFWVAFQSPVLFAECKNWTRRVGTAELRNFEVKLLNHAPLVKVGFLVSMNGFTRQVLSELKRAGRAGYHVVLIERADIDDYLSSDADFFTWLEGQTARFH